MRLPQSNVIGNVEMDFQKSISGLFPVARGALSLINKRCTSKCCKACKSGKGHPTWIFSYRKDGVGKCMHVQPRHVEIVRQAIENGRKIEAILLDEGIALIKRLREQE